MRTNCSQILKKHHEKRGKIIFEETKQKQWRNCVSRFYRNFWGIRKKPMTETFNRSGDFLNQNWKRKELKKDQIF